jgi:hypothetical protein
MEAKSIQKQKTAAESRGNNRLKFCKRAYKPGSVQSQLRFTSELTKFTHTLPSIWDMRCRMPHATILELTPGKRQGILPCVLSGVAPDRVYMNDRSPGRRRALISAFPPLHRPEPSSTHAVYLCCTCPEVSLGGCYPLSCPTEPGLSSFLQFAIMAHGKNAAAQPAHKTSILLYTF